MHDDRLAKERELSWRLDRNCLEPDYFKFNTAPELVRQRLGSSEVKGGLWLGSVHALHRVTRKVGLLIQALTPEP